MIGRDRDVAPQDDGSRAAAPPMKCSHEKKAMTRHTTRYVTNSRKAEEGIIAPPRMYSLLTDTVLHCVEQCDRTS